MAAFGRDRRRRGSGRWRVIQVGSGKLSAVKRAELRGKISMLPGLNRSLRVIPGGLLRVDKTGARAEALGRLPWFVCADHL